MQIYNKDFCHGIPKEIQLYEVAQGSILIKSYLISGSILNLYYKLVISFVL